MIYRIHQADPLSPIGRKDPNTKTPNLQSCAGSEWTMQGKGGLYVEIYGSFDPLYIHIYVYTYIQMEKTKAPI